jgi:hypothetical protein
MAGYPVVITYRPEQRFLVPADIGGITAAAGKSATWLRVYG